MIEKHWTATLLLIEEGKVLLIWHPKFSLWLPPGGHVDPGELIHEAALRETKEEVGLNALILSDERLTVDEKNAKSVPRPFLMQLEEIPPHKDQPAHQHIDAIFVGRIVGDPTLRGTEEAVWWPIEELEGLHQEGKLFKETMDVVLASANWLNTQIATLC
jgi:ADP-ribose pyrophosphatase YjhB (NUDIX family)